MSDDTPDTEMPDIRSVGITFDTEADCLNLDVGEWVGDFEALGMLLVALMRQAAKCAGATLEYGPDDDEDD